MYASPPTMEEINASPKMWTGVSLFSGCGGSSTGHAMAGIQILLANEFSDCVRECYELNHPETKVIDIDVRRVSVARMLTYMDMQPGDLDLLDGCPPEDTAQDISTWGKPRSKGTHAGIMFAQYVRILTGLLPKTFCAEFIRDLKDTNVGHFLDAVHQLRKSGYHVRTFKLNACWAGIPQDRQRVVLVGVRKDLGYAVPDLLPSPEICTLSHALPDVLEYETQIRNLPKFVPATNGSPYSATELMVEDCRSVRRKLTISELKAVSGLPPDYRFVGTPEQKRAHIGTMCVPQIMELISKSLITHVLEPHLNNGTGTYKGKRND